MNIWEFFDKHDITAFIAICLALTGAAKCVMELICLCKLPFRSYMVAKKGWPTIFMDADGDIHYPPAPEQKDDK